MAMSSKEKCLGKIQVLSAMNKTVSTKSAKPQKAGEDFQMAYLACLQDVCDYVAATGESTQDKEEALTLLAANHESMQTSYAIDMMSDNRNERLEWINTTVAENLQTLIKERRQLIPKTCRGQVKEILQSGNFFVNFMMM